VREIDRRENERLTIPYECGVTRPELHGSERVLNILVDSIWKNRADEAAREIHGTYREIGLARAIEMIRLAKLVISWMSVNSPQDLDLVACLLSDGVISLVSPRDTGFRVLLDLTP
jgi:hypothetical protein